MTDVQKGKTGRVFSAADVLHMYAPPPVQYTNKMGIEVEMPIVKIIGDAVSLPTSGEMQLLKTTLENKGYDAQLEPAGVIEYASPPTSVDQIAPFVQKVKGDLCAFFNAVSAAGYKKIDFSIVPTTHPEEALKNIVARDRLQMSLQAMKSMFGPNVMRLPLLTASTQASFSPQDEGALFKMTYRSYALMPLLMAACNSCSGYVANDPDKVDYLPRGRYYQEYGAGAGISESFLKSSNGKEFINNHIDEVFNARMHFAYDDKGNLFPTTKEVPLTFKKLVDMGLNTVSNYELAESFLYHDVKICNLRDENKNVVGKRLEVRGADSGADQALMVTLLTSALVPEGPTAAAFENLLKDYGFTGNPPSDAALLSRARHAVVEHGGKFMDVDFGVDRVSGNPLSLRDFAADVAGLLVQHFSGKGLDKDMGRLLDVLMTGNCDAKIFSQSYKSLDDVRNHMIGNSSARSNVPMSPKTPS